MLDARIKLANALARAGRLDEAIDHYDQVLDRRPEEVDLAMKKATALLNLRRVEAARALLTELVDSRPGDAVAHVRLAELDEAAGRPDAALARYRAALALDMTDRQRARIHHGVAGYHQRRGETAQAIEELRAAAERDPTLVAARLDLAGLLGVTDRFSAAADEYRRVLAEAPLNPQARYGEAAALLLGGRRSEARARLEESVAVLPDETGLRHLLARLLAAAAEDDLRDGERGLELALEVHSATPGGAAAETVAMAYAELGEFDRAAEWQRRALDATPAAGARDRLALFEAGRPYRAETVYDLLVAR